MSNIITSYFEIVRLDGNHLTSEEQDWLFQGLVRAYQTFGSYWVRIHRAYHPQTRRMWIHFGSSKHQGELDEFININEDFLQNYALWTRLAHDGDTADRLSYDSDLLLEGVQQGQWEDARYGFNGVVLAGSLLHPDDWIKPYGEQGRRQFLPLTGSYLALTDRGFVDLIPPFHGPCLAYDPLYQPGRYLRRAVEMGPHALEWQKESIELPQAGLFQRHPGLDWIAWCWRGRVVQVDFSTPRSVRRYNAARSSEAPDVSSSHFMGLSADGWGNLVNPAYLKFRAWHTEQVRLADHPRGTNLGFPAPDAG
jgi:hypothetical protein